MCGVVWRIGVFGGLCGVGCTLCCGRARTDLLVCRVVVFWSYSGEWEGFFPFCLDGWLVGGIVCFGAYPGVCVPLSGKSDGIKTRNYCIRALSWIFSTTVRYIPETIEISLVLIFFAMHC